MKKFTYKPYNIIERLSKIMMEQVQPKISQDEKTKKLTQKKIRNNPEFAKLEIEFDYLKALIIGLDYIGGLLKTENTIVLNKALNNGTQTQSKQIISIILKNTMEEPLQIALMHLKTYVSDKEAQKRTIEQMKKKKQIKRVLYGRNIYINGEIISLEQVDEILEKYWKMQDKKVYIQKLLESLVQIGLSTASIIGIMQNSKNKKEDIIQVACKVILDQIFSRKEDNLYEEHKNNVFPFINKSLKWSEVAEEYLASDNEEENDNLNSAIKNLEKANQNFAKQYNQIDTNKFLHSLMNSIISGYIIARKTLGKDKIDGQKITEIYKESMSNSQILSNIKDIMKRINVILMDTNGKGDENLEFKIIEQQVLEILTQYKEYDSLISADRNFEQINVNFNGKLHETNFIYQVDDFYAKIGEVIYISGNSGNGKSTFLKTIYRGDLACRGIITLDGKEKVDCLRKQSIIFSKGDTRLIEGLSIEENIAGKEDITDEERKMIIESLKEAQIDIENLQDMNKKSLGQEERILIARVIYRIKRDKKSIVFLDEPIGQVEAEKKEQLMKNLTSLAKKYGIILILTSHEKKLAEKYCTRQYEVTGTNNEPRKLKEVRRVVEYIEEK